jgi:hypothetical protein
LPGSNESGVLLLSKIKVPPLWVDGLTTPVRPALNATAPVVVVVVAELPLPLLLQAPISSAATAPTAVAAKILRLFIRETPPCTRSRSGFLPLVTGSADPARRAAPDPGSGGGGLKSRARTPWSGTTSGVRLWLPSSAGERAAVRTVSKIFEV